MRQIAAPYTDPTPLFRHGDASRRNALAGPFPESPGLDFSICVNPLGPPTAIREGLSSRRLMSLIQYYPPCPGDGLAVQLQQRHPLEPGQVVVGNGSTELIYLVPQVLRPRRVAIVEPTFTEYLRASLACGADIVHWLAEGEDFRLEPFDPEGADLVWLCNPNNPTGQMWPRAVLESWIRAHPRTVFVVDEAYLPFRSDENRISLVGATAGLENLVVIRSLTKIFTMPGLRLGYAVANPALADWLRARQPPWSVNGLAQLAGSAALLDAAFLQETHQWLEREGESFHEMLRSVSSGLRPLRGAANFLLIRLEGVTGPWLTRRLEEQGIRVRDASNFVGLDNRFVRVAIRQRSDNERLARELRLVFQEV